MLCDRLQLRILGEQKRDLSLEQQLDSLRFPDAPFPDAPFGGIETDRNKN